MGTEGCHLCLRPSSSLHCHLFLPAGENLVSEPEGEGEEGEQEEAAAAEPAHQHHHTDPTSCQHAGTHRRPLQQQRPQPRLLISTDDQGRIHALTLSTSYRPREKSTMQQSPASPCALRGDSPFPKTGLSLAEPRGQTDSEAGPGGTSAFPREFYTPLCKKHGLGTALPQEPRTGLVSGLCSPRQGPDVSRGKGVGVRRAFLRCSRCVLWCSWQSSCLLLLGCSNKTEVENRPGWTQGKMNSC